MNAPPEINELGEESENSVINNASTSGRLKKVQTLKSEGSADGNVVTGSVIKMAAIPTPSEALNDANSLCYKDKGKIHAWNTAKCERCGKKFKQKSPGIALAAHMKHCRISKNEEW